MVKLRGFLSVLNIIFIVIINLALLYLLIDVKALLTMATDLHSAGIFSTVRIIPIIICAIIIGLNVLLILTFAKSDRTKEAIQFTNETGVVRISAHSIESLAKLEAQAMEEVTDIRTQIYSADNNAALEVYAKVPPSVSIPEISLALQNNIKRKIIESTGIDLTSIKIIIDGIIEVKS